MKPSTMKSLAAIVAATPLAAGLAKTIANPAVKENYASGEVMDSIMSAKYVSPLYIYTYIAPPPPFSSPISIPI